MTIMTLFEYFNKFSHKKIDFAQRLGVAESSLYKYINQEREPKLHIAIKIHTLTDGYVSYKDLSLYPQDIEIEENDEDLL